jgi:hypothetical protein
VSGSGWAVLIGLVLTLAAGPLARVGEMSGAVLQGEPSPPVPATPHPALAWVLRLHGVVLTVCGHLG